MNWVLNLLNPLNFLRLNFLKILSLDIAMINRLWHPKMIHIQYLFQIFLIQRLMENLFHTDVQAFINCLSIGMRRQSYDIAFLFSLLQLILVLKGKYLLRWLKPIHYWHVKVHDNKFVIIIYAPLKVAWAFKKVVFKLLKSV